VSKVATGLPAAVTVAAAAIARVGTATARAGSARPAKAEARRRSAGRTARDRLAASMVEVGGDVTGGRYGEVGGDGDRATFV
jgi:hypothetical protein